MAQGSFTIEVRVAWWVRWYLAGVQLVAQCTGLAPDMAKVEATALRGVTVPSWRPKPSLRRRFAAAYERSAWIRAGFLVVVLLVFYAGMAALWLAPIAVHPIALVLWLLAVATAAAWVVVP